MYILILSTTNLSVSVWHTGGDHLPLLKEEAHIYGRRGDRVTNTQIELTGLIGIDTIFSRVGEKK